MHVKLEPNEHLDLPVDLITDIESDLFREHLFGNSTISNSEFSESSSEDDHISKLPPGYEPFSESFTTQLPMSVWDPASSRSSSTSSSFDQTFAELEYSPNSFSEFSNDDLDIDAATCSPHDVIMSPSEMKEEPTVSTEIHSDDRDSPNPIWDLLCSTDVKPNIKTLETPPVTPESVSSSWGDSPPSSPHQIFSTSGLPLPQAALPSPPVITVHPFPSADPPAKKIALAPKIPFKIVTTITANENRNNCFTPQTIKIQPRPAKTSLNKPIIGITNHSAPKFSITKVGSERSLFKVGSKAPLQKPLVISTSHHSQHSKSIPTTITIPTSTNMSTCNVITEKKPRLPPLAPAINPGLKNNSLGELRAIKRQQRMIKNRESASLSRKRKKEYLQGLEDKVRELDLENAKLRAENERLLRRVTSLENERVIMRAARFPIKRSSTAIMGFVFLLLFNASPIMNLFKGGDSKAFRGDPLKMRDAFSTEGGSWEDSGGFHHRSLLSLEPLKSLVGVGQEEEAVATSLSPGNVSHICPIGFNTTESIRIENELRDWFDSSTKEWSSSKTEPLAQKRPVSLHPKTKVGRRRNDLVERKARLEKEEEEEEERGRALAAPLSSPVSSAAYQYLYRSDQDSKDGFRPPMGRESASPRDVMPLGGASIQSLLDSIERRNDTYYVVSLTADHVLLPASAHNTSARPKMSLLVAAPKSLGDPEHVGIMQIDCEVTHTRLVRWTQHSGGDVPSVAPSRATNATEAEEKGEGGGGFRRRKRMKNA